MATTKDTTALQKGALTPAQAEQTGTQTAVNLMSTLLSTPTLPTGTSIAPQLQTIQTGELQTTPGVTGTVVAGTPTAANVPVEERSEIIKYFNDEDEYQDGPEPITD